jgi:LacI family transcriptional regulator
MARIGGKRKITAPTKAESQANMRIQGKAEEKHPSCLSSESAWETTQTQLTLLIMRRVTLRDIAKAAGVSHVTVSLALRNQAQIPTATRNRIRSLADKMGYVPDPALGRLNAYRRFASSESPGSALA